MTPTPFAPGDIVRCITLTSAGPDCPLRQGHIYTVRGVEAVDGSPQFGRVDHLHLHGIPQAYGAWRFALVARADNDAAEPGDGIAHQMAAVMRERLAAEGQCTIDDLARAGFTSAQIIEYADEARGIAGPAGAEAA